jgi:hypothetical protein
MITTHAGKRFKVLGLGLTDGTFSGSFQHRFPDSGIP